MTRAVPYSGRRDVSAGQGCDRSSAIASVTLYSLATTHIPSPRRTALHGTAVPRGSVLCQPSLIFDLLNHTRDDPSGSRALSH